MGGSWLPRLSLQVWTGGKSVHHYCLKPLAPQRSSRLRRSACLSTSWPTCRAPTSTSRCRTHRILGMGGPHPKTGERSVVVSAGGQHSLEALWNLTGEQDFATWKSVQGFYGAPTPPVPPRSKRHRTGRIGKSCRSSARKVGCLQRAAVSIRRKAQAGRALHHQAEPRPENAGVHRGI